MPVIVPPTATSLLADESKAYAWGQQVGSALAAAFPEPDVGSGQRDE